MDIDCRDAGAGNDLRRDQARIAGNDDQIRLERDQLCVEPRVVDLADKKARRGELPCLAGERYRGPGAKAANQSERFRVGSGLRGDDADQLNVVGDLIRHIEFMGNAKRRRRFAVELSLQ